MAKHPDQLRALIGKKLAKHYLEGMPKSECILLVFPKMNPLTARKECGRIFRRYEVTRHLLSFFPDKIDEKDCERLVNHLIDKAIKNQDDSLLLQLVDRIAKLKGRYSETMRVETKTLEEEETRLKEAEMILRRARIDPAKINLN